MQYITGISDCDNYLINYLPLTDIINLLLTNTSLKKLVSKTKIYSEYAQLKGIGKNKILEYCYEKGLINILKNYYWNKKNIFIDDAINYASKNAHIVVINWFKESDFQFKYNSNAINYASENGHIAVLQWFKESGLEFKYSTYAINYASKNGREKNV